MPRHILINLTKIKLKEKLLKAGREKQQIIYKGVIIKLTTDFTTETLQVRRKWQEILKVMKRKTEIKINQQGYHSDLMEKSKALQISKSKENSLLPNQLYNKY